MEVSMDLYQVIRELYAEKKRLEEAIVSLEELIGSKGSAASLRVDRHGKARRGRKNMPPDERRRVSERMKKYWARRRAVAAKSVFGAHS
jgi:hypothetical protein